MGERTVGQLLGACLHLLGARRVFGVAPLPGLAHVPVADPTLARTLADADGRTGTGPGVAWLPDQQLRLSSRPGTEVDPWVVDDPSRLAAALATWTVGEVHATREFRLDLDLAGPAPADAEAVQFDTPVEMYRLNESLADLTTVVVAGPGVVRHGQVGALAAFAAQAGVGVLNTWGAKGVFRWDSPHHLGTGGLQARDLELAGVLDSELVVVVGLDDDELGEAALDGAGHVLPVQAESLASLAFGWDPLDRTPERPALYRELSEVLADHYASDQVPLRPARAAADLAAALPSGGLVAADPGPVGLWVARAFPTTEPGSVVVPATVGAGFAVAAAMVAGLDGRPAVAVTTGPLDRESELLVDLARSLEVPVTVEVWGADGALAAPEERAAQLSDALSAPAGVAVRPVPVDLAQTRVLEEVAGPVVAWSGLAL